LITRRGSRCWLTRCSPSGSSPLLACSELFTENFLVPVTARIAGRGSRLLRLWLVTLAANLTGGLVMAGLIVIARPDLRTTAAELGRHYATLGLASATSSAASAW
jgi:formate/nitrite transporter FocA (FNT family)